MADIELPELPEPGIYKGVSFDCYKAVRYPNASSLKWGLISMVHMKSYIDGRMPDTDSTAKRFGRAEHCMVLEPERFESEFLIAKPCQELLKSGPRKGEPCGKSASFLWADTWFCGTHKPNGADEPRDYVTAEELERIKTVGDTLHKHEVLQRCRKGFSEVTGIFDWLGIRWKIRIDRLAHDNTLLFDLKKTGVGNATVYDMEQSIKSYGWHRQMVLYLYGVALLTGTQPDGAWVFAEDNEPFDVNILHVDHETISVAEHEIETVAKQWRKAVETGVYPGYLSSPRDVRRGGLPERYRQFKLQEIGATS